MNKNAGGSRLLPVLTGLLILVLGGALAAVLLAPAGGDDDAAGRLAVAARAQQALAAGRAALAGDADALGRLEKLATELRGARAGLEPATARRMAQLADTLDGVAGSADALRTVQRAAKDLDTLAVELGERVYALEGAIAVQRGPAVTAQLERLRLLADAARRDVASLAAGVPPDQLTQPLLDAEMGLAQIVRGFQEGDPELGLAPVSDGAALDALAAVGSTTGAIGNKVRDVVASAEPLAAAVSARAQLDALGNSLAPEPPRAAAGGGLPTWLLPALIGAALLLALAVLVTYLRAANVRRAAALQAEQTERNQRAIMRLLDELASLADGDLTAKATVTEDITGAIADSINYAIEALRELVATVNGSAIMVDGAARRTDMTAQQLAEASAAQSKQIQAASQAIGRMVGSIEEVSGNAERSADVARHSVDVAHKGGDAVRRTIEGMNAIRETIQDTSKRIKRLGESSQEIGNIVELINDIADQTNILALNASIQASMAGDAGRGFAVVADEVQRLAERSANATKQIEVLVRTIQADTNEAVVSMERSTTDVVGGALLAENAGAALEEIEQVSNQIAMLVQNISDSAGEQARSAASVTKSMEVLQGINTQTAATTSETTEAIRELAALSAQLRESVAGFRLPSAAPSDDEAEAGPAAGIDPVEGADEASTPDTGLDPGGVRFADQRTA